MRPIYAVVWFCLLAESLGAQTPATVNFGRDVQPVLRERCYGCHGPSQQMQGLRLDRRRFAMPNRVGANRASIVPGKSDASPLYLKLVGKQAGLQMPPDAPLSPEQINTIKTWIDQGAEWPDALSGETSAAPADPQVIRIMESLRHGERQTFLRILRENPGVWNRKGPGGSTPLMYASIYGDADSVRVLLERGADPNARNDANATALMYAIDNAEKTRLLLERGADATAVSDEGQTPLLIAVTRPGASDVVKLLLDHGAKPSVQNSGGRPQNPLSSAASAGDKDLIQLLLERGANKKPVPLAQAVRAGCGPCIDALMPFAEPSDFTGALTSAAQTGDAKSARMWLDRGGKPAGGMLSALALSPEAFPPDLIEALIAQGANANGTTTMGGTILDLARLQGDTTLVHALTKAGAKEGTAPKSPVKPQPAGSARAAIEKSLPLMQRADVAFIQKAGCISCHNNSLSGMARAAARKNGIAVNEQSGSAQLQTIGAILSANAERALQGLGLPGGLDTAGYILLGLTAEKYPADATTDVWARYLKNLQQADGHWRIQAQRPPVESSDIEATVAAMRAIQVYAPKSYRNEYAKAVQQAARWLEGANSKTTEDRVFQLLGLQWVNGSQQAIKRIAKDLVAAQNPDGGWSQLSTLPSDAYATGQALMALSESGSLSTASPAYQRGVQYLLNSQLEDGSWYVRSRTLPVQPYFDSDFPHGRDQFISAAATAWATMALAPVAK